MADKLDKKESAEADKDHKAREKMPGSAFLESEARKYPVKVERDGSWHYDKDLLVAAEKEAEMHGHKDLAARAKSIREREFSGAQDGLSESQFALDRSARAFDADGRMRVNACNISKAVINEYYGQEIPGYQGLGLDALRRYKLLRHPDELMMGADSFKQLPLLSEHVPVSAADHRPELVVGSTGSDVTFDGTYLKASLMVWDQAGIDAINSGDKVQLSCAYRYTPDMTPGTYQGQAYDGVMRRIVGNHVALVRQGRAGPDVVVADSKPTELFMNPSRIEIALRAALGASLKPQLAQDASLSEVTTLVRGVTRETLKADAPKIVAGLVKAYDGKLAADAQLDPDALEATILAVDSDDLDEPKVASDASAKIISYLSDRLSKKDLSEVKKLAADASEEDDEDDEEDDEEEEQAMDKQAMDAAIEKARQSAESNVIARMHALRTAEKEVAPHVGEVDTTAMDSAESVYKLALDAAKVDLTDVDPSAYRAMVRMLPKEKAKPVAMDSNAYESFHKQFPDAVIPRSL